VLIRRFGEGGDGWEGGGGGGGKGVRVMGGGGRGAGGGISSISVAVPPFFLSFFHAFCCCPCISPAFYHRSWGMRAARSLAARSLAARSPLGSAKVHSA